MRLVDILKLSDYKLVQSISKPRSLALLPQDILPTPPQAQFEKLADKVYTEFARSYYKVSLPMKLKKIITLFYEQGGCMKYEEASRKKGLLQDVRLLREKGIILAIPSEDEPKEFYLPTEYLFYLGLIMKEEIDEKTLYRGLLLYKSDEIKKLPAFIYKNHHSSSKPVSSKAENQAIVYDFVTTHSQKLKEILTPEQEKIIRFVAERKNMVSSRELLQKFPLPERSIYISLSDIIQRYGCRYEPTELQKLFLSGLLIPLGNDWNSFRAAAIPQEIYPILAREYLVEIQKKQGKLIKKIGFEELPNQSLSNEKDITLDVKRVLLAVELLNLEPTQSIGKKGLGKRDLNRITEVLKENNISYMDCLSTFLWGNRWIEKKEESLRITKEGRQFLSFSEKSLNSYKAVWGFFTRSPQWNELLKTVRMLNPFDYNNQNMGDFILRYRMLLIKLLGQFPRQWIKADVLKEILLIHREYDEIKLRYDYLIGVEAGERFSGRRGYYNEEARSRFVSEEGIFWRLLSTLYYLGFIEIYVKDGKPQALKLTPTGRYFISHERMDFSSSFEASPEKEITVQPNMEIICSLRTSLTILQHLSRFCKLKQIDRVILFEISRQSLIFGSAKYALKFKDIEVFLSQHANKPLPQNILYLLKECAGKEEELEIASSGGYLIAKEPHLLETIRHQKVFQPYIQDYVTTGAIILREGAGINKLLTLLRKKGYMPRERKNV